MTGIKTHTKKDNNGNTRSNESGMGLYSRIINHAKRNGTKDTTNMPYDKLPEERKKEWDKAMEKELRSLPTAISPLKFYDMKADKIQFSSLHRRVLEVLEEMYNQQSVDNTWNWMNGKNGTDYEKQGRVYTNPTQIAKYLWGTANPKCVQKIVKVIYDLNSTNVYLGRTEIRNKREVYSVKRVTLIITTGTDFIHTKTGLVKEVYSYIQLHPVFFERITKNYIYHRNDTYKKIQEIYLQYRDEAGSKQKYMIAPDIVYDLFDYLCDFPCKKVYNITIDEETLAEELNINEFKQRRISRGRNKLVTALDALFHTEVIKLWKPTRGKNGQQQYVIELSKSFFGGKNNDNNDKILED